MHEKHYTIGEFAAMNKITARMLRHYDKVGLLKPSAILENGYRAYTSPQIQTVSKIRLYQSCGFTLAEIKELLCAGEAEVQRAAKQKRRQLEAEEKTDGYAQQQLLLLAGDSPVAFTNHYDISYTRQSEQLLFCSTAPVGENQIEQEIERLYRALDGCERDPDGCLLLFSDFEENAYRVAIPVIAPVAREGYSCVARKAGWYLSTLHYGDYSSIGMAYDRLYCYAEENGRRLLPPLIERYLLDAENAPCSAQYITQILIELTP